MMRLSLSTLPWTSKTYCSRMKSCLFKKKYKNLGSANVSMCVYVSKLEDSAKRIECVYDHTNFFLATSQNYHFSVGTYWSIQFNSLEYFRRVPHLPYRKLRCSGNFFQKSGLAHYCIEWQKCNYRRRGILEIVIMTQ